MEDIFDEPVKIVDPKSADFQKGTESKAGILADSLLNKGIASGDVKSMALALTAYSKYKQILQDNPVYVLEKLASLSKEQLSVLEKSLKNQKNLDNFKGGKITLEDAFSLPGKKKVRKRG